MLHILLVWVCLSVTNGYVNEADKPFDFRCPLNLFLNRIVSVHYNFNEDRRYNFDCKIVPIHFGYNSANATCTETDYVNDFDQPFEFGCHNNGYIGGMASYHDDAYEDRKHKFRCCSFVDYHMMDCENSGWVNTYDDTVDFRVPDGKVLRGVASIHDNSKEDRIFSFEYCSMIKLHSGNSPILVG